MEKEQLQEKIDELEILKLQTKLDFLKEDIEFLNDKLKCNREIQKVLQEGKRKAEREIGRPLFRLF